MPSMKWAALSVETVEADSRTYEDGRDLVPEGTPRGRLPHTRIPRELRAYRTWALAHRIPEGVRDPAFIDLVQRIEGGVRHRCPPVRLLVDGEEAFREVVRGLDA